MSLRPVGVAAARLALHRSTRSRGYKLLREGAVPSLVVFLGVCVDLVICVSVVPRCGPCLPFYSFQG
jgi:hypothetical protein